MDPTLGGSVGNVLYFLGEIAFWWVPSLVTSATGSAPDSTPALQPITQPVTIFDVASYVQASSDNYAQLMHSWSELVVISVIVSLLLTALLIYCVVRILEVRRHEHAAFKAMGYTVAAGDIPKTHLRWNKIIEEASSPEEAKWRLAILEADIMLNELLDVLGYRGDTMADKMKQVEKANFRTIDMAWEAHKVRNAIAHQGSTRLLGQQEVRRVIALYEQVFREFKFIE